MPGNLEWSSIISPNWLLHVTTRESPKSQFFFAVISPAGHPFFFSPSHLTHHYISLPKTSLSRLFCSLSFALQCIWGFSFSLRDTLTRSASYEPHEDIKVLSVSTRPLYSQHSPVLSHLCSCTTSPIYIINIINMADANSINMNGLSLEDSQHAGQNGGMGRSAYIPPHARRGGPPGPPATNGAGPGGMDGSAWAPNG